MPEVNKDLLIALSMLTAWDVEQDVEGKNAFRLTSPFVFGDDGTVIAFSLLFTDEGFYLCDNADHAMLASAMGISLGKAQIRRFNETSGVCLAKFDDGGEILARGKLADFRDALFDAAKLALALSFYAAGKVRAHKKAAPKGGAIRAHELSPHDTPEGEV